MAAFLAQIGHESNSLRFVREVWVPTPTQERYEGRVDLGNTQPGDGKRFRGRGLIQVTGRENNQRCADFFGITLDECLPWLETPEGASLSAGWYFAWYRPQCVRSALAGDFPRVCRIVNGGLTGIKERTARYAEALRALDVMHAPAGGWPQ